MPHPAGPCAAANTHGRIWNPPLRNGKVRGQPGSRTLCGIANLCRGRCENRPGDPAPPQGLREGHGPPLQTFRAQPAKPDGRKHPDGRRAGCPHPAGLCGAARAAGGIDPSPTTNGGSAANRGAAPFAISQTSVGDDACIVPQPPHSRKARGRAMALPYKPSEHDRPNWTAATTRTAVGRDALIPPGPAAK